MFCLENNAFYYHTCPSFSHICHDIVQKKIHIMVIFLITGACQIIHHPLKCCCAFLNKVIKWQYNLTEIICFQVGKGTELSVCVKMSILMFHVYIFVIFLIIKS